MAWRHAGPATAPGRTEVEARQLQGAQAVLRGQRIAAQRDGQGAEEVVARAVHRTFLKFRVDAEERAQ